MCIALKTGSIGKTPKRQSLSEKQSSGLTIPGNTMSKDGRIKKLEERVLKLQRMVDIQEEQKDSLKRKNIRLQQKVRELLAEK
jgi:hypothetical protein